MAGLKIECHLTHFDKEEQDDVWIRKCAEWGWAIVTSDKATETDPVNRLAVIESGARIFFLDSGSCRAIFWAAAMVVSKQVIYQTIAGTKGPFFANITRETATLVKNIRQPTIEPPTSAVTAAAPALPTPDP